MRSLRRCDYVLLIRCLHTCRMWCPHYRLSVRAVHGPMKLPNCASQLDCHGGWGRTVLGRPHVNSTDGSRGVPQPWSLHLLTRA